MKGAARGGVATELPDDHPLLSVAANQDAHINLLEVRDAYLRLSEEHREVLLLVAIEGRRYADGGHAAQRVGVS